MQDIAIILGSLAGVATAAVAIRIASKSNRAPDAPQATEEVRHLEIERDILTKTIARLYETDSGLTNSQRDGLLIKYQRQMEAIQIKMQRLKHAGSSNSGKEIGGMSDLMIRVDEKLSRLDERIHELSSSMAETKMRLLESNSRMHVQEPHPDESTMHGVTPAKIAAAAMPFGTPPAKEPSRAGRPGTGNAPKVQRRPRVPEIKPMPKARIINTGDKAKKQPEPSPKDKTESGKAAAKPKTGMVSEATHLLPEDKAGQDAPLVSQTKIPEIEEPIDDINDSDDLNKIKDDINKALAKLAQTEVE